MKVVGRSKKGKGVKGKFGVRQGEKKRSEELAPGEPRPRVNIERDSLQQGQVRLNFEVTKPCAPSRAVIEPQCTNQAIQPIHYEKQCKKELQSYHTSL